MAVLHIEAAARVDAPAHEVGQPREITGAAKWAPQMIAMSRGVSTRFAQLAVINGSVGVILAPNGKLVRAMTFSFADGKVTRLDAIADPARLSELDIAVLQR